MNQRFKILVLAIHLIGGGQAAWAAAAVAEINGILDTPQALEARAESLPTPPEVILPYWAIDAMSKEALPNRIVMHEVDASATTVVSVMDAALDLPFQVASHSLRGGEARVPFAPPLVVGEGQHADNHTIVKMLDKHGLARITFLAYPPSVKGGVQVSAGRTPAGRGMIATAPLVCAKTREIRLFNLHGGLIGSLIPELEPPYAIATGDFLSEPGTELAVCSRSPRGGDKLALYRLDGSLAMTQELPEGIIGSIRLTRKTANAADSLILFSAHARSVWSWTPGSTPDSFTGDALAGKLGVCEDAFAPDAFLLLETDPVVSAVTVLEPATGNFRRLDVGQYENRFWVVTPPRDAKPTAPGHPHPANLELAALDEGRYVKFCDYAHLRMDARSPGYENPPFNDLSTAAWTGDVSAPDLSTRRVAMWEPCFTHRGFPQLLDKWKSVRYSASNLPAYMMVTRDNDTQSYLEMNSSFALTSYAPDVPELDHLYLDTLSGFLRNLAARFREHPERLPSLEPNHEMEIPLDQAGTFGDYNPHMIRGFYQYLRRMYGELDTINATFQTPFGAWFDAPRGYDRGTWDAYGIQNPYFRAWRDYNRWVVNLRLAQGFRESLLAGFPPEVIKAHQIPAIYFKGRLDFSDVASRISPIDYVLSAGVGGGYTRYGIWYKNKHNFLQASHSSGHDAVVLGEYNSLATGNEPAARQLAYMYDHGVQGVHVMGWTKSAYNSTMAHAVAELIRQDRPRPGAAGGVSDSKAFVEGDRRFNIAVLGATSAHTGLLKSLKADGTWEGSVYTVPFKAHTGLETLLSIGRQTLVPGAPIAVGPINDFNGGSQVELTFSASGPGTITYQVRRGDTVLPGLSQVIEVQGEARSIRIIHRTQVPGDGVSLQLVPGEGKVSITGFNAIRHTTRFANVYRGIPEGKRHQGGLTFDIVHRYMEEDKP